MKLTNSKVTAAGLKELAGMKDLMELDLWASPIGDAGLKELAAFKQLKVLSLSGTKVSDAGFRELAPLTQLEDLMVEGMRLGNTAAVHIAKSVPSLKILNIGNNQVGIIRH